MFGSHIILSNFLEWKSFVFVWIKLGEGVGFDDDLEDLDHLLDLAIRSQILELVCNFGPATLTILLLGARLLRRHAW